jgi:hypothetical protein
LQTHAAAPKRVTECALQTFSSRADPPNDAGSSGAHAAAPKRVTECALQTHAAAPKRVTECALQRCAPQKLKSMQAPILHSLDVPTLPAARASVLGRPATLPHRTQRVHQSAFPPAQHRKGSKCTVHVALSVACLWWWRNGRTREGHRMRIAIMRAAEIKVDAGANTSLAVPTLPRTPAARASVLGRPATRAQSAFPTATPRQAQVLRSADCLGAAPSKAARVIPPVKYHRLNR